MRHLDLFSGIGGFSLGLERAGFKTVAFSEIEQYPSNVLANHWPETPNFGDIRKIYRLLVNMSHALIAMNRGATSVMLIFQSVIA